MNSINLKFTNQNYQALLDSHNLVASSLLTRLPLKSEARNIGGEIFFRIDDMDVLFDGTEREEFDIGDIVYWRSPKGEQKFAIAMFYGNTKFSDWKSPRAASPCVKIGQITEDVSKMDKVESGESIWVEKSSA